MMDRPPLPWEFGPKPDFGTELDGSHPINRDIVCWYVLNEGAGGSVFDISGRQNDGQLVNVAAADWLLNDRGDAVFFGGTDTASKEHILAETALDVLLSAGFAHSFACWVDIPTTSEAGVLIKIGANNNGWAFGIGSGTMDVPGNDLIGLIDFVGWRASTVKAGTGRQHIGYTWSGLSGTGWRFFLNGKPVSTQSSLGVLTPTDRLTFCSYAAVDASTRALRCTLEESRVWSRVLSDTEFLALCDEPNIGYDWRTRAALQIPSVTPPSFRPQFTRAQGVAA